jgi:dienelactone hydrolase
MTDVALFHSALGVRRGVTDAAERLRAAGHRVRIVDQYDGRVFDDYAEAGAFVEAIGFPELMRRAVDAVADLPDGFLAMGFSNGGGMATYVALKRRLAGAILCSGALPLQMIGAEEWPAGVPVQLHCTVGDPRKLEGAVESVMRSVNDAGADAEYVQYPGSGHLFTDQSLPDEYDPAAAGRFWNRVLAFCAACS